MYPRIAIFASLALVIYLGFKQINRYGSGQDRNDSLSKYSYLLVGNAYGAIHYGTGFFIRTQRHLFLVSAQHIFSGRDAFGHDILPLADTLSVRCSNQISDGQYCLKIALKPIREKIPADSFYKNPDVYLYQVNTDDLSQINSIEEFIGQVPDARPDSVISFGYGGGSIVGNYYSNNLATALPLKYTGNVAISVNSFSFFKDYNVIDTNLYAVIPKLTGGMSGSPIFLIFGNNSPNKMILFGGVAMGQTQPESTGPPWGYVVRLNVLLKKLREADN
jgi:hypothetical protein